jgi:mannosyltransferase
MATVTAPPRPPRLLPKYDVRVPERLERQPSWLIAGVTLIVLVGVSAFIRTRYISGEFWMDEAITTGIASHPLTAIPGILRHDGSPPLFYLLLHGWMGVFGASEAATHALPLLFGLLTIPVGMWAGWSLFGRRAGLMAAVLFAFSSWLTDYAQETRMYELMALLGLIATACFLHAFVFRRRKYLIGFAVALALMLYTHGWALFFGAGAVIALIPVWRASDDRRGIVRDAVMVFVGAGILFLPWLPNFLYQVSHTAAPWDHSPRLGAPVQISRDLLGGDRVTVALVLGAVIGLEELFTRRMRRTREGTAMWVLILLPFATLALAWIGSQVTPAWVSRYFAPVLASILLLAAWGSARARTVGVVAIGLCIIFLANPGSFAPQYKSNMRDVGGEMTPLLHQSALVVVGQPEEVPLSWYYLPGGLRYASTIGPVSDPRYMDWVDALKRLRAAKPAAVLPPLIAGLAPGQQLLYIRPLTEGAQNWEAPWTQLVRRRSAQWGEILQRDVAAGVLRPLAYAPHNYRSSCCVANSAVLYEKVG